MTRIAGYCEGCLQTVGVRRILTGKLLLSISLRLRLIMILAWTPLLKTMQTMTKLLLLVMMTIVMKCRR